jgi:hypothetical protein
MRQDVAHVLTSQRITGSGSAVTNRAAHVAHLLAEVNCKPTCPSISQAGGAPACYVTLCHTGISHGGCYPHMSSIHAQNSSRQCLDVALSPVSLWPAIQQKLPNACGFMMMMMILHHMRHGRQDNHATNHVRCAETSRAKQSRKHIKAKHSETINLSIMCQWSTMPAKQSTEKAPRQCLLGKHNL